jgi:hypothetical protein
MAMCAVLVQKLEPEEREQGDPPSDVTVTGTSWDMFPNEV